MAQHPHVPKFGNWERENIAYTAYFENARKGRGVGGRIINPNDPEENPADFKYEHGSRDEHHREPPKGDGSPHIIRPPPSPRNSPNKNVHRAQQFHQEKKHHGKEGSPVGYMKFPYDDPKRDRSPRIVRPPPPPFNIAPNKNVHGAQPFHQEKHHSKEGSPVGYKKSPYDDFAYRKREASYSGNDESYSASPRPSHHSRVPSKDLIEQRSTYSPSMSLQQPTARAGNNHDVENRHRGASVPKFGAWDVTNPQSEAGYTMIFDKVKEEKQKIANKRPDVLITPSQARYSHYQEINYNKSTKPKMLCCFFP